MSDEEKKPYNPRKLHWGVVIVALGLIELACSLPFILAGWFYGWARGGFGLGIEFHNRSIGNTLSWLAWLRK